MQARIRDEIAGFTLLEVMVAVAILGLALTVILSSQMGLFASGTYGQHVSVAMGLSRCRMSELEQQLLQFGYPLIDQIDEGPCCGGETRQDMRCAWRIESVLLPQPQALDFAGDGGVSPASSSLSNGGALPPAIAPGGGLGPLGALAGATSALSGLGGTTPAAGTSGLSGVLAAGVSGGSAALAPMVMSIVYPSLKPMLEASIRKLTVTVLWREGIAQRNLELVQWVTNPMTGGFLAGALGSAGLGAAGSSQTAPNATAPSGARPTGGGRTP